MHKKLYYSLIILICVYCVVLFITGGFTFQLGKIILSSHKSSNPILLFILLTGIQFVSSSDFRNSVSKLFGRMTYNHRYFITFILSLLFIEMILGCLHLVFYGRILAFNLDKELTFATYFSAFIFLANSLVAGTIYQLQRKSHEASKGWLFIAFVFFYLTLDEVGSFHESLIPLLKRNVPSLDSMFNSNKYWVVVLAPFIVLTIIYFAWFLFKKLKVYPLIITGVVIAILLWMFIIGLELWEGYTSSTYVYKALVEEGSEVLSSILFLTCFLTFFKKIK